MNDLINYVAKSLPMSEPGDLVDVNREVLAQAAVRAVDRYKKDAMRAKIKETLRRKALNSGVIPKTLEERNPERYAAVRVLIEAGDSDWIIWKKTRIGISSISKIRADLKAKTQTTEA